MPDEKPPVDWPAVRRLFDELLALPPQAREAALAASGATAAVQGEVRSLLQHALTDSNAFLAAPAAPRPGPAAAAADGTARPRESRREGQRVGPWRITAPLGRGGMGEVWLAQRDDGAYEGRAAVKVLRTGLDSQRVLDRFALEQRALARLDHPNIARLLDAGRTDDGQPCFVMEAVDGQPIDQACAGLPLEQRLQLFLQLADAVAHAHRQLLVHRDLKPSNVLVVPAPIGPAASAAAIGQVKLLDFGIAKAIDPLDGADPDATAAGERPFTPNYASPEQVRGEPVGTATDVYSLGVLLYVMLTGVRPYGRTAGSAAEAARSVLEEPPTRPSALSPALVADPQWLLHRRRLAGDLDNILLKALDKGLSGRYASVDALAADVRAYLGGFPVSAQPAGWPYRARKFAGRHRAAVAAAALGLSALVVGLGLALWQREQAEAARLQAEQQRALAQQRFGQLRQLANQLVFKYHDQIESLPAATPVREALLADAAEYLDDLAASGADDPGLSEELAGTYYRIARLQGIDASINTGRHADAARNLDKALALMRRYVDLPGTATPALARAVDMQVSRAEAWQRSGQMARADATLRAALPLLERTLARDPSDTWALAAAISLHGVHARILGSQTTQASLGRWAEACRSADRARTAAEATLAADAANVYAPDSLAFTVGEQAHCQVQAGRLDDAAALFERQRELRELMAERLPDDMDFRWQRAVVRAQLARVRALQGRHAEAQALLREANAIAQRAIAADPGNDGGRRRFDAIELIEAEAELAAGHHDAAHRIATGLLARLPPTEGDSFADAAPRTQALLWAARASLPRAPADALRHAIEAARRLAPARPDDDNVLRRWWLAQALGEQAAALAAAGRPSEAATAAGQALQIWAAPGAQGSAAGTTPAPVPWQLWIERARQLAKTP